MKAAHTKAMLLWLAHVSRTCAHDAWGRLRAVNCCSIAALTVLLDTAGPVLTVAQARRAQRLGRAYLLSHSELARQSAEQGMKSFKLTPKFHYFDHILEDLSNRENPKWFSCMMDEDYMGRVTRVTGKCHRVSCVRRCLLRYRLCLYRRWEERCKAGS